MNFIRFLRNLLVFISTFYLVQHIYNSCPLNSPLIDESDSICLYSHKSYNLISPYVSSAYQSYESSSLKPIVDRQLDNLKPGIDYISIQLDKLSNWASKYRQDHEQQVFDTYDYSSKTVSNVINSIAQFINNTIYPVVSHSIRIALNKLTIYSRATKIYCYMKWNIYIKPFVLKSLYAFSQTKVGQYCIIIEQSFVVQKIEAIFYYLYINTIYAFEFVSEKVHDVYNINVESKKSEAYELLKAKQAFLLDLAQYLPDSFNFNSENPHCSPSASSIRTPLSDTPSETYSSSSSSELSSSTTSSNTINPETSVEVVSASSSTIIPVSEKYESLLKNTIASANEDFVSQVTELASQYKTKLHSKFQPEMRAFGESVNSGYDKIHALLNRINEIKDSNDPLYVSRQDYRDALAEKKSSLEEQSSSLEAKLNEELDNYLDQVLKIRVGIIETLEEFADSTLAAYSSEIISNGDNWEEWKKYKDLKKSLIEMRDELIDKKPNDDLKTFANKLKREIYLLTNEAGSYMAILRAKANLEFQSREKEEREALAAAQEPLIDEVQEESEESEELYDEEDEELTETITQTKYVTKLRETEESYPEETPETLEPVEEPVVNEEQIPEIDEKVDETPEVEEVQEEIYEEIPDVHEDDTIQENSDEIKVVLEQEQEQEEEEEEKEEA